MSSIPRFKMNAIQIHINGKTEALKPGTSLRQLLESKGINPATVACELNLKIVRRAESDKVILKENDALEIIRMIGGG